MKCDTCNKPATVHLTEIRNGKKIEKHLCEQCAAAAHRFGGAAVDPARMPRFDLPEDLQRAAQGYDLSAEPDRPGALVQFARALGLVAAQGSVE